MSERILFVDKWRFHDGEIKVDRPAVKGPVYTQSKTETYRHGPAAIHYDDRPEDFGMPGHTLTHEKWEWVTLPHDYIVNSPITKNGNNALGFYEYRPAWYRKHFNADESWRGKRVEIEFLGIATECDIYFNGAHLAHSETQYTPIIADLTDFIKFDRDNVIAVHVTTNTLENWWYNGAGICHKVYINVSNPVAVERDGVFVAPKKVTDTLWHIPIEVEVHNNKYFEVAARVKTEIKNNGGEIVCSAEREVTLPPREVTSLSYETELDLPRLWDIDDPYLYYAETYVFVDGEISDKKRDRFGFRTIEFDAERGFLLNGRKRFINGLCGHEDFSLTGKAVPDNIMRHKVRLYKEMGCNAYRCSHSMQDEAFMDAFDEYGIMVMAETRHFSSSPAHMAELRALVRRDRNRPSVFMWSVGNEEHYFVTDEGRRIAENMTFEVKKLDKTRPVMTANDKTPEQCTVYDISDLVAVNYNHQLYDYLHEKYPNKPLFSSECSAAGTTRGWYYASCPERGYMTAYDCDINAWFLSHENTFSYFRERPWIMGGFMWTGMEYLGEAKWPRICSCSGAIDLYFQKKDAFYQNQTFFKDEPMVHILPHWNMQGRDTVTVYAYTNCASVELFLNGESLGKQLCTKYVHNEWNVKFVPGTISAVAYDTDGNAVARTAHETTGPAVALKLRFENEKDVCANGEDVALFTCYAVDSEGREVPDAECVVSFISDEGVKVVGTGSDNTDHTPPSSPDRRMMAGRVLAAFIPLCAGKMNVYAKAGGLAPAMISVDIPEDKNPVPGRVYPAINRKF